MCGPAASAGSDTVTAEFVCERRRVAATAQAVVARKWRRFMEFISYLSENVHQANGNSSAVNYGCRTRGKDQGIGIRGLLAISSMNRKAIHGWGQATTPVPCAPIPLVSGGEQFSIR